MLCSVFKQVNREFHFLADSCLGFVMIDLDCVIKKDWPALLEDNHDLCRWDRHSLLVCLSAEIRNHLTLTLDTNVSFALTFFAFTFLVFFSICTTLSFLVFDLWSLCTSQLSSLYRPVCFHNSAFCAARNLSVLIIITLGLLKERWSKIKSNNEFYETPGQNINSKDTLLKVKEIVKKFLLSKFQIVDSVCSHNPRRVPLAWPGKRVAAVITLRKHGLGSRVYPREDDLYVFFRQTL